MSASPLAGKGGGGGAKALIDGSLLYRMQLGNRDGRETHSGHRDS